MGTMVPVIKQMYWKGMKTAAKTLYQNPNLAANLDIHGKAKLLDKLTNHVVGIQLVQGLEQMLVMHYEGVDIYA